MGIISYLFSVVAMAVFSESEWFVHQDLKESKTTKGKFIRFHESKTCIGGSETFFMGMAVFSEIATCLLGKVCTHQDLKRVGKNLRHRTNILGFTRVKLSSCIGGSETYFVVIAAFSEIHAYLERFVSTRTLKNGRHRANLLGSSPK